MVVIEDDPDIGTSVVAALVASGYEVDRFHNGAAAAAALEDRCPDFVLLDVGLPDMDGITICRWLRDKYRNLPIVLLTARDSEIDIVVGLDAGATDYVTKPFSMTVLLARLRAHLRSATWDERDDGPFDVGRLSIDPAGYTATIDGEEVGLRPREMELLVLLAHEAGRVVTRDRILAEVWDQHWESSSKTLETHVMTLRRKLNDAVSITTVRGVGYRLDPR